MSFKNFIQKVFNNQINLFPSQLQLTKSIHARIVDSFLDVFGKKIVSKFKETHMTGNTHITENMEQITSDANRIIKEYFGQFDTQKTIEKLRPVLIKTIEKKQDWNKIQSTLTKLDLEIERNLDALTKHEIARKQVSLSSAFNDFFSSDSLKSCVKKGNEYKSFEAIANELKANKTVKFNNGSKTTTAHYVENICNISLSDANGVLFFAFLQYYCCFREHTAKVSNNQDSKQNLMPTLAFDKNLYPSPINSHKPKEIATPFWFTPFETYGSPFNAFTHDIKVEKNFKGSINLKKIMGESSRGSNGFSYFERIKNEGITHLIFRDLSKNKMCLYLVNKTHKTALVELECGYQKHGGYAIPIEFFETNNDNEIFLKYIEQKKYRQNGLRFEDAENVIIGVDEVNQNFSSITENLISITPAVIKKQPPAEMKLTELNSRQDVASLQTSSYKLEKVYEPEYVNIRLLEK